jgi:hypothetical protein
MPLLASMENTSRLVVVDLMLNAMKSRVRDLLTTLDYANKLRQIWEGITPMSNTRWQSKDLDDPDNIHEALGHIQLVVTVFDFLSNPDGQSKMRETYNLIFDELEIFDTAMRPIMGKESFQFTAIWANSMRWVSSLCHAFDNSLRDSTTVLNLMSWKRMRECGPLSDLVS